MFNRGALPLPVEIFNEIFQYLDLCSDYPPILRVNTRIHEIAIRELYSEIEQLKGNQALRLLISLRKYDNPEDGSFMRSRRLPRRHDLMRSLELDFYNNELTENAVALIRAALRKLPRLTSLTIELSSSDNKRPLSGMFPLDAPFRLKTFITSVRYEPRLAEFLESQPELLDLSLRGLQSESVTPFKLRKDALPRLQTFRSVHAGPGVLAEIVANRPVQGVSLSLYPDDDFYALASLALSSVTVKRLTILILDYAAPAALLPKVATHLPNLEALHIVALVAQYDMDTLRSSASLLSSFASLRYLTFMASNAKGTVEDEAAIATSWAQSCPTLRTIIMPQGKVWFTRNGRWVYTTEEGKFEDGKAKPESA